MVNKGKIKAYTKTAVVSLTLLFLIVKGYEIYAVDMLGAGSLSVVSSLKLASKDLCKQCETQGTLPETYNLKDRNIYDKYFSSFSYTRKDKDWYEINASVKHYFKNDSPIKANLNGIYMLDSNGEWSTVSGTQQCATKGCQGYTLDRIRCR